MAALLIIEGTSDTTNGNLREGFHKLLKKLLVNEMLRKNMGEGKSTTIKKIINSKNSLLLCDLYAPASEKESDLRNYGLINCKDYVFYMIQEMEAWFISQPKILDKYYNREISCKLAKKHGSEFNKPDEVLEELTKDTSKGKYHKIKHGVHLLSELDASKLKDDFLDFKQLIDKINNN